jgi:hypothetical protein
MEYRFRGWPGQPGLAAALFAFALPSLALAGEVAEEPISVEMPLPAGESFTLES